MPAAASCVRKERAAVRFVHLYPATLGLCEVKHISGEVVKIGQILNSPCGHATLRGPAMTLRKSLTRPPAANLPPPQSASAPMKAAPVAASALDRPIRRSVLCTRLVLLSLLKCGNSSGMASLAGTSSRTAQKYSNAIGRERLRQAANRQRPAPTTANDLAARSSHRGGQGFESHQLHFKDRFRTGNPACFGRRRATPASEAHVSHVSSTLI
jgi:hypothetical protein